MKSNSSICAINRNSYYLCFSFQALKPQTIMSKQKNTLIPQYFIYKDGKSICRCNVFDEADNNYGIKKKKEAQCGFILQVPNLHYLPTYLMKSWMMKLAKLKVSQINTRIRAILHIYFYWFNFFRSITVYSGQKDKQPSVSYQE